MLVLTRKTNQSIRVGNNVTITILKVRGNTVRLGIEAPREVPVIRGELEIDTEQFQEPVTLEFKTNPKDKNNALRLVCKKLEDTSESQDAPKPAKQIPVNLTNNRLQQLVSKVAQFE